MNMLPKPLQMLTILSSCICAISVSQLTHSNFPQKTSFDSTLSGTTYLPYLPERSIKAVGTSVSRFSIANLETGFPSSPSAVTKVATSYSVLQPATTGLLTTYASLPSASSGLATESSASKPVTRSSASQPTIASLLSGCSTLQLPTITLSTEFPVPQQSDDKANGIPPAIHPALTDPSALRFADSILNALVTSEKLQDFADSELKESDKLFFNYGLNVLSKAGISDPYVLSNVVAQAAESLDKLSSKLFFTATANTLAKFLISKRLLTVDNEFGYYQQYIDLVDNHPIFNGIHSKESIVTVIGDSFFQFLSSIGALNSIDDYVQIFRLFAQELRAYISE